MAKQEVLLLEDVYGLGRKGDIVKGVAPGYVRNFLLPKSKVLIADRRCISLQERLQKEREEQALKDRSESEATAKALEGLILSTEVKVDPDGHMYGSVTVKDAQELLESKGGIAVERHEIQLKHPIKTTGVHTISLKLKEGVEGSFTLKVMPEGGFPEAKPELVEEAPKASDLDF